MRRALLLAAAFGATATAWADAKRPNPFLSQAKVFATQGEGDKCLKRLIQAEQKWKHNDKKDRAEIEMYGGICGYLVGETQAAAVSFKNAVKIDPKIELPRELGPGIEALWAKSTGKSVLIASAPPPPDKKEPGKKPPEKAPEPAPPPPGAKYEPPLPRAPPGERKLTADEKLEQQLAAEASAPPPETAKSRSLALPIAFGVAAVGAGAGGLVLGLQAKSHEAQFKSLDTYYSDAQRIGAQAKTEALVTNILFAAAGALVLGAILSLVLGG